MTTPPAVYGEFGRTLAFAERALTVTLRERLAQRGIVPETWYVLQLIELNAPKASRDAVADDLAASRRLDYASAEELLARLEREGLIRGDAVLELTPEGEELHRSLREHIARPTFELLSQFDLGDIQTTVRTLQAITEKAESEAHAS